MEVQLIKNGGLVITVKLMHPELRGSGPLQHFLKIILFELTGMWS